MGEQCLLSTTDISWLGTGVAISSESFIRLLGAYEDLLLKGSALRLFLPLSPLMLFAQHVHNITHTHRVVLLLDVWWKSNRHKAKGGLSINLYLEMCLWMNVFSHYCSDTVQFNRMQFQPV